MYPELFKIGSLTVHSYGLMILIGVICAWFYMKSQTRILGLDADLVSELLLWCFAGVFVGGKIFFYLEDPAKYLDNPSKMLDGLGSGFVFYGSFLTTIPILIWWFRKHKLPVWHMFDLVGIAGAFVHGFGKIGCFFAGCCHGRVCHNAWGISFTHPKTHAEPMNTPLYPTQLWDAAMIFTIIALMIWLKKRRTFEGQLFLVYGLLYAVGRFFTEKYRGDEERGFVFNGLLSHSQAIALGVFLVFGAVYAYRFRQTRNQKA